MGYGFYYGYGVVSLPGAVGRILPELSGEEAKVLLCLGAHPELLAQTDSEQGREAISRFCGVAKAKIPGILTKLAADSLLVNASVLPDNTPVTLPAEKTSCTGGEVPSVDEGNGEKPAVKKLPKHEIPSYSAEEVAHITGSHPSLPSLLKGLQKELGKTFSEHEIASIVAFIDHFGLGDDYLLTLFHYLNKKEKSNMRYIERTVIGLTDDGIVTTEALEHRFAFLDEMDALEQQVRIITGIKDRAFTTAERGYLEVWTTEKYPHDLISFAFDETVNHLGKCSIPYMNKILEKCREKGITTRTQAEAATEEYKRIAAAQGAPKSGGTKRKSSGKDVLHSFDTASFLEAALANSYADDSGNTEKEKTEE